MTSLRICHSETSLRRNGIEGLGDAGIGILVFSLQREARTVSY
jgi:hypothetical protein